MNSYLEEEKSSYISCPDSLDLETRINKWLDQQNVLQTDPKNNIEDYWLKQRDVIYNKIQTLKLSEESRNSQDQTYSLNSESYINSNQQKSEKEEPGDECNLYQIPRRDSEKTSSPKSGPVLKFQFSLNKNTKNSTIKRNRRQTTDDQ